MEEDTTQRGSGLRWYFSIIWHWGWLVLLVGVLCGGIAYFGSQFLEPVFQSTTTIYVKEPPSNRGGEAQALAYSERLAQTYTQLITAQPLLDSVVDELGLPISSGQLKSKLTVSPVRQTVLIRIDVRDSDRQRAVQIANTLVERFAAQQRDEQALRYAGSKESLTRQMEEVDQQIQQAQTAIDATGDTAEERSRRDRLQSNLASYRQIYSNLLQNFENIRLAEAQSTSNVIQVERATVAQISPRVLYNTLLGTVAGLLLTLGGVFLKEVLDDTVKDPEELSRHVSLPILGYIAHYKGQETLPIVVSEPRAPIAEAFRTLRTNIQFSSVDRPITKLIITSASPSEGKSTVSTNLAAIMAQSGRRITMIEADLRRPTVHKKLDLINRVGMSDLFVQPHVQIDGVLQPTAIEGLSVITSGELPPNPAELLGSEKMREILHQVEEQADMVLVDTPPVLAVTDAMVLAQRVDGVLLVVRAGTTRLSVVRQAVEQLRFVNANILGIVLNDIQLRRSRYGYSYHGYYYAYQSEIDKGSKSKTRGRRRSTASAIETRS